MFSCLHEMNLTLSIQTVRIYKRRCKRSNMKKCYAQDRKKKIFCISQYLLLFTSSYWFTFNMKLHLKRQHFIKRKEKSQINFYAISGVIVLLLCAIKFNINCGKQSEKDFKKI